MKVKDIEEFVTRRPFQPFRLVLNSGEEVTVHKPRKALLSGETLVVVGISRQGPKAMGSEKLRIMRVGNIISAEDVGADQR